MSYTIYESEDLIEAITELDCLTSDLTFKTSDLSDITFRLNYIDEDDVCIIYESAKTIAKNLNEIVDEVLDSFDDLGDKDVSYKKIKNDLIKALKTTIGKYENED